MGTVSWWILKTSWFLKNFDFKKNHCLSSFPRWLTTLATWKQSCHEDSKCNFSFLKNYIGTLSKALFGLFIFSGSKRRSRGWMYSVKDAKRSKLAFPKFCRNILLKIINFYLFSCIPASNGWLRWQETIFSFKAFAKNPKWEDSLNINGISVFHQKQLLKEIVGTFIPQTMEQNTETQSQIWFSIGVLKEFYWQLAKYLLQRKGRLLLFSDEESVRKNP